MSSSHRRRSSGAAGAGLGLGYLLIWVYKYIANHTTGRTRDILLQWTRVAINSTLAFLVIVLIFSCFAILLPWVIEPILTWIFNSLGIPSDQAVTMIFGSMLFLSLIAGSIMEIRDTLNLRNQNSLEYSVPDNAPSIVQQSPTPADSFPNTSSEYISIDPNVTTCKYCGYPLEDSYAICPNCGTRIT